MSDQKKRAWYKGMPSPNKAGRPPIGLALTDIARADVPGKELVDIFLCIARGEPLVRYQMPGEARVRACSPDKLPENAKVIDMTFPTTSDRLRAGEFLWDKIEPPAKSVTLDVKTNERRAPDFSKMSPVALDRYLELSMEMRALAEPAEPGVIDTTSSESGNKDA